MMVSLAVRMILLAAVASLFAAPARAQEIAAPALSSEELGELRGGFVLPTGIEADFGAIARTYADGVLVLETRFTWTADGVQREDVAATSLVDTNQLTNGFALDDSNGETLIAHQLDNLGLRNILLNDASNRDIRVDTQLTVTLPSFALTQQDFRDALLSRQIFDDMQFTP